MAQYEEQNPLDYRAGGDTVDDFAQKYMKEIARIYQFLNNLREHNSTGPNQVEPQPYQFKVTDNKLYIRNAANSDWLYLFDVAYRMGMSDNAQAVIVTTDNVSATGEALKLVQTDSEGVAHISISGSATELDGHGASYYVTTDDIAEVEAGTVTSIANKLVKTNANGVLPVNVLGNAGKLAGCSVEVNNVQDGQVLTYRVGSNSWRNENKGVIGDAKALTITDGDTILVEFSGESPATVDTHYTELSGGIVEAKGKVTTDIATHNTSAAAHDDIRTKITTDIGTHNSSANAHSAKFEALEEKIEKKVPTIFAGVPNYYVEDVPFHAIEADNRTTILSPEYLALEIGGIGYVLDEEIELDIDLDATWNTDAQEWEAEHDYSVNDVVYPLGGHTNYYYRCIQGGTSSSLTPVFPTTVGQTEQDGTVIWECQLDYTQAVNRTGKDFYIYAVLNDGELKIVTSVSALLPLGYTASTARKIGGFHCLCVDVGTDTYTGDAHPLYGYEAGDVLPMSVWDCWHRPVGAPEGYVYDPGTNVWFSIYGLSWTGSYSNTPEDLQLVSVYHAEWADGASAEKFHANKFDQVLARQHQRLPWQREFVNMSLGSNQGTNIVGSADPGTTGGHKDTSGKRMISNIGCEDCCGDHYQWGLDVGSASTGSWTAGYDANDKYVKGDSYTTAYRVLLGGAWNNGSHCGSRSADWGSGSLTLYASVGGRGASEPLHNESGALYQ